MLITPLSQLIGSLSIYRYLPQVEVAIGDNQTELVFRLLKDPDEKDKIRLIEFGKNNETCTVLNGRQVTYEGEPWYLSNLTNKLLDRTGPMDGSPYWYFNGKNLKDIYNETYSVE